MEYLCGIIGLPNIGKSTLFNTLTSANVRAENFPFCTIQPNISKMLVIDDRLNKLIEIVKSQCITPCKIGLIDIAGMIKGSSTDKDGIGKQIINYISNVNAIIHVIRCFNDDNIIHINNNLDPVQDVMLINNELILSDIIKCENIINRNKIVQNKNKKDNDFFLSVLFDCFQHLNKNCMLRTIQVSTEKKKIINSLNFLTFKPNIYLVNIKDNQNLYSIDINKLKIIAKNDNSMLVLFCAKNNLHKILIDQLIRDIYKFLNLKTFFTINNKETKAWSMSINNTVFNLAKNIHSDFAKNFIRAQIIKFDDFIFYKNDRFLKKAGKILYVGKTYQVKDGDIIKILHK